VIRTVIHSRSLKNRFIVKDEISGYHPLEYFNQPLEENISNHFSKLPGI